MELVIKPTEICNFHCTFCSSTDITVDKKAELSLEEIRNFLIRFPNTSTIIVNGGDPLIMKPKYYFDIIEMLDSMGLETTISIVSNLWDFKKKPDKWAELFNHERIGVCTSFHYGDSRRITPTKVFTESDFIEIFNLFKRYTGRGLDFLSVIDDANYDMAIENVRLAKKLDVECKLNKAVISGRQQNLITQAKMYELYLKIIEEGLAFWEYNSKQLLDSFNNKHTTCPLSRNCDSHIRTLHPDGTYYSCPSLADDGVYPISFREEVVDAGRIKTPLSDDIMNQTMKAECWSCEMFNLCNGCRKTIKDTKDKNKVEEHCSQMKKIAPYIKIHANEYISKPIIPL